MSNDDGVTGEHIDDLIGALPRFDDDEIDETVGTVRGRLHAEALAGVERVRSAAMVTTVTVGRATIVSAVAAVAAWGVLFGVRVGESETWTLLGLGVLVTMLVPTAALWYLGRQLRWLVTLPDQFADLLRDGLRTASGDELRERLRALAGKRGVRLVLELRRVFTFIAHELQLDTGEVSLTLQRAHRAIALVPISVAIGVPGTLVVMACVPLFAVISALVAALG